MVKSIFEKIEEIVKARGVVSLSTLCKELNCDNIAEVRCALIAMAHIVHVVNDDVIILRDQELYRMVKEARESLERAGVTLESIIKHMSENREKVVKEKYGK